MVTKPYVRFRATGEEKTKKIGMVAFLEYDPVEEVDYIFDRTDALWP